LNAFATPGGYIYVYAGLILYLETEDHLVGVIGHEIAHAERRHSVKQLEKQYGVSLLLSVVAGQSASQLTQIAGQIAGTIAGLAFSRGAETEADEFAVKYTKDTDYACNGVAGFFQKLEDENAPRPPEFLSTHPNPDTRIEDINNVANALGCDKTEKADANYSQFQQWVLAGI
jgi:predicted Zn-dependent protease